MCAMNVVNARLARRSTCDSQVRFSPFGVLHTDRRRLDLELVCVWDVAGSLLGLDTGCHD